VNYNIYKLYFKTPVHFGKGRLSTVSSTFFADTLFSAMCKEAIMLYGDNGAEMLYNMVLENKLKLSDSMPFNGDMLFVPKPIIDVEREERSNIHFKRKLENLDYIPIEDINNFLNENYDPSNAIEMLEKIGKEDIRTCVSVKEFEDNEPYNIGIYNFNQNCGLYFIAIVDQNAEENIDEIVKSLSFTGIGGKISSGLGKFEYTKCKIDKSIIDFEKQADIYMSLSLSMANDSELENAVKGASYKMVKRSGFVSSENYSDKMLKKRDFYCFKCGSCFKTKFDGGIFDVGNGGNHPVYRYAKPMFIAVR